jgi:hypothetical protein
VLNKKVWDHCEIFVNPHTGTLEMKRVHHLMRFIDSYGVCRRILVLAAKKEDLSTTSFYYPSLW